MGWRDMQLVGATRRLLGQASKDVTLVEKLYQTTKDTSKKVDSQKAREILALGLAEAYTQSLADGADGEGAKMRSRSRSRGHGGRGERGKGSISSTCASAIPEPSKRWMMSANSTMSQSRNG